MPWGRVAPELILAWQREMHVVSVPGKTWPPLVVPMNGKTKLAGSAMAAAVEVGGLAAALEDAADDESLRVNLCWVIEAMEAWKGALATLCMARTDPDDPRHEQQTKCFQF